MTETVGSTATPERGRPESEQEEGPRRGKRARKERKGVFARLRTFYRQIISELRKVVWPTRNELMTYTSVVIVFVIIIMGLVYGLDTGFAKLAFLVFG